MSDGLPRLLPNDPQNLLSVEARKRIQRALIEADKFIWEAEVTVGSRSLSDRNPEAQTIRNKANFDKAKAALSVYRTEFSRINLSEQHYREIMREEIEAASNSLELSGAQRRLLEVEFYFPEEQTAQQGQAIVAAVPVETPEAVAEQIRRLRKECNLTEEELAEEVDLDTRTVQRHEAGDMKPQPRRIRAYERIFSKLLKRNVVIKQTP